MHLCAACERLGRCRLGIESEFLDDAGVAHYAVTCPRDHEGHAGIAHGGWTASVLDEACAHLLVLNDVRAVTASLAVEYLRPVPVGVPLAVRASLDSKSGHRWMVLGVLLRDDLELARGRAVVHERRV